MKTTLISLFRQRRPAQQTVHLQAFTPSALHPILDWPTPPSAHADADAREGRMRGYTTVLNVEQRLQYRKPQKTGEKSLTQNLELSGRWRKFVVFLLFVPRWIRIGSLGANLPRPVVYSSFPRLQRRVLMLWYLFGRLSVDQQKLGTGGASGAGAGSWGRLMGDAEQRVLPQTRMEGHPWMAHLDGHKGPPDTLMMSAASSISTSALDATPAPGALAVLSRCLLEVG